MPRPVIPEAERLLTPAEVAAMFGRDPKTITRWAREGRFGKVIRTPGGHRRYPEHVVRSLLDASRGTSR